MSSFIKRIFFAQRYDQQITSSPPKTKLAENLVISQKSESVTQAAETKRVAADKEVIVLSSDSESDNETIVVSRKTKGKEKEHIEISTNKKKGFLDDSIQSNKGKHTLPRLPNPVRRLLNMLEEYQTNSKLFEIITDFTKIYLEIYEEDKLIITKMHDYKTLKTDLTYCLMLKIRDGFHMATSEKFEQLELLAWKTIEIIDKLKETGNKRTQFSDERKRRNEEEGNSQDKRRRLVDEEKKRKQEEQRMMVALQLKGIRPRKKTIDEAEIVDLLAEPLHNLITAQLVYSLYDNFSPYHMTKTVDRCTVHRIFKSQDSERTEYCKQLYCQYVNTNMVDTTNVIETWIRTRISESATPYLFDSYGGKKRI